MASSYELKNRDHALDSRRIIFAEEIRLLSLIDVRWAEAEQARHLAIRRDHPYRDPSASS